ncbi:hypothetical protein [Marinibactrum halimedae]|uniref:Uncharacterized protein n=1 Tax=Marinibactrum halimedae TaxID=1444977 RepID=A0AA37WL39_9GAMM|nr:hypothetical protein [Marinibactrum halimedae]MCD9457548.1 hypothetical protein [Marinibactrum halimedae]GLS25398.1 hypothetical protein GCM10007877_11120 [Marinibactrum halimedae]
MNIKFSRFWALCTVMLGMGLAITTLETVFADEQQAGSWRTALFEDLSDRKHSVYQKIAEAQDGFSTILEEPSEEHSDPFPIEYKNNFDDLLNDYLTTIDFIVLEVERVGQDDNDSECLEQIEDFRTDEMQVLRENIHKVIHSKAQTREEKLRLMESAILLPMSLIPVAEKLPMTLCVF